MKLDPKPFLVTAFAVVVIGAGIFVGLHSDPPVEATKVIKAKIAPIENRVSTIDTMTSDGSSIITKSRTVYYLVADDGTAVEVSMSEYALFEVGAEYTSSRWEHK